MSGRGDGPPALAAEERLLVAATDPQREDAAVDALVAAALDWPRVVDLFDRHHVLPLLPAIALPAPALPAAVADELRMRRRRFACVDMASVDALGRVLAACREASIDAVVLKGFTLAEPFYRDPAERFGSDIDLLVRPEDRDAAGRLLEALGFAPVRKALYESSHFHVPYRLDDPLSTTIELHWNLTLEGSEVRFDMDRFWSRRRPVRLRAGEAFALAPDDAFVHLCWHAFNHGTTPLRDLADVARVARGFDAEGWERIERTARRSGATAFVATALRLIDAIWGRLPRPDTTFDTTSVRWAAQRVLTAHGAIGSGDRLWWPLRSIVYWSMLPPDRDGWSSLTQRVVRDAGSPLTGLRASGALLAALICCAALREPWRVGLDEAGGAS